MIEPDIMRRIPSVDELLRRPGLAGLWARLGPGGARRVIAQVLNELRVAASAEKIAGLESALMAAGERRMRPSLRPVINATGVILHTNLGRAPLSAAAAARVAEVAAQYCNLEFDLETGQRGRRDRHLDSLLAELTGAERSLVVNNNAAAIVLALNTLAEDLGGEVLVSRGELVEIGESFRIADIIARGGAKLVEVGATNRTRLEDYERARGPRTRVILRVHRSNFVQTGFVAQPGLAELAGLARRAGVALVEDLGSGCLAALPGQASEPLVRDSVRAGVDLVTYSGDKLLGGPQAGLISGRGACIERLRANPLFRALRADRMSYAGLEATLEAYARGDWAELPVHAMQAGAGLEARTRALAASLPPGLGASVEAGEAVWGGGAAPGRALPGWRLAVGPEGAGAEGFARRLREQDPPVVARLEGGRCWVDLRTVLVEQEPELRRGLEGAGE